MHQFLNDSDSLEWLRNGHLKGDAKAGRVLSFVIEGNEDCPEALTLYASADPLYSDVPMAVYRPGPLSGDLICTQENGKPPALIWDRASFRIGAHFLPWLINADATGLSDSEWSRAQEWEEIQTEEAKRAGFNDWHWSDVADSEEEFARCEITGSMGKCVTVRLMCAKPGEA